MASSTNLNAFHVRLCGKRGQPMPAKTTFTTAEYKGLVEPGGVRYELSGGELVGTACPSFYPHEVLDRTPIAGRFPCSET